MPDRSPRLHVALAGPIVTEPLAELLDCDPHELPRGLGGTATLQLASDLVDRGQEVSVVTLARGLITRVEAEGPLLRVVCGPYRDRHRMRDFMRVERLAVRDELVRVRPDLVHANWSYEFALGALSSGLPTLVTVRDWAPTVLRLAPAGSRSYWAGRAVLYFVALARARHVTANSPYTAAKARRFTRASVEVVPNGMPDRDFVAPSSGDENPVSSRSRPVVISVNNGFGPLKNTQALLRAHGALLQRGVECKLQLIGTGYEASGECEQWARRRGLAAFVEFMGPLPRREVLARMRDATVLMHPSREESFGMTLVEAMSQRVPVIGGTASGAVPWVLGHGQAGLLVDVRDVGSIASAVEQVVTNRDLRERLASAGREHAWRNFRQSTVTDLYLEAYRRLLREEASSRR